MSAMKMKSRLLLLSITAAVLVLVLLWQNLIGPANGESTRPTDALVQGVNYVGVSVGNLDASTEFFATAVNLQAVEAGELRQSLVLDALADRPGVRAATSLMKSSNAQLRFMQFANPSRLAKQTKPMDVQGPGIAHVCFQVAKKTKAYDRFLSLGAAPIGVRDMVRLNVRNPVEYAYARDLDSIIFEVEHVDVEALDLDVPPKNDYRIRHVSLATPDMNRAVKFYSVLLQDDKPRRLGRLFGLSGEGLDQVSGLDGAEIEMAWFQVRNLELEIIQYLSHPTQTSSAPRPVDALGYNMIVFEVTDLGAVRQKLVAAGGVVVSEALPMDGGLSLFGRDPDGNLLGFQQLAPSSTLSSQNFKDNGL